MTINNNELLIVITTHAKLNPLPVRASGCIVTNNTPLPTVAGTSVDI